jgi:hypothetical protein
LVIYTAGAGSAHRLYPNATLHFEDFGPEHATAILA